MATHAIAAESLGDAELPGSANYHLDIDLNISNGANAAGVALAEILNGAKGINYLRNAADPTVTRAAYLANVEKAVDKFNADAVAKLDNARRLLASSLKDAEGKLKSTVGLSPSANAAEIRSVFRSIPIGRRQAELSRAFDEGNAEVISAIVGFDPLMHGCDPETIASLYDQYQKKVAPAEYESVVQHKKYVGYVERVSPDLMAFRARALKGTGGYMEARNQTVAVLRSYGIEYID